MLADMPLFEVRMEFVAMVEADDIEHAQEAAEDDIESWISEGVCVSNGAFATRVTTPEEIIGCGWELNAIPYRAWEGFKAPKKPERTCAQILEDEAKVTKE